MTQGALTHNTALPSKSKMADKGPKMADGVWICVYPEVLGHSKQLSLNKFFDPGTTSPLVGDHPWWVTILGLMADRVWKGVYR